MFESKTGILFIAGIGFFAIAFLSNGLVPMLMYKDLPEKTTETLVKENNRVMRQFGDLQNRYAEQFEKYYGKADEEACAEALRLGRQVYVGEGCWHCHSQFVRPVSNESLRWGPVAKTEEYQNELQRPVLFGTRRVGPDLSREGGRRSNDWHAVHFYKPQMVSTASPMPNYPWLFDGSPDKPNKRGLALITYVQWLGSWHSTYPYYEELKEIEVEE
ncbi:MAG: cbb3-type cytochrome c oxidase subunit II [Planctomycetaceae bacterium]